MSDIAYLDNAASSPLRPEALEAMSAYAREHFANPSAIHALGQAARKALEKSRGDVAASIGADASEVIFTSGATEANNLALRGILEPLLDAGKPAHAVTTALEHASVLKTFEALEKRGLSLTIVPPGADGLVKAEDVLGAVRAETALVSVIAASNEIGTLQPVEAIGKGLKKMPQAPLFHVDAVQAIVSTPLGMKDAGADLFTISAHKIGGPKGVGALGVRKGVKLAPVLTGGGHEGGLRSGTENASGIAGFGEACISLRARRSDEIVRYRALRARLIATLPPGAKPLIAEGVPVAPHILPIECVGKENDWLVLLLSRAGVMAAAGSACKSGSREASSVIRALGLDDARARSVIRASFGYANDEKDVDRFVDALAQALRR
ncbi:MAG TPA: cysteine desulfurase family protein [Candidatus Baltobacteraceae bacterium]|nr:cysteine desulfurase family protein [Candidatus Baltobacteraceae bacterium]